MRNKKPFLFAFCIILSISFVRAQDKSDYKFGKIAVADFKLSADQFDSGANALIIADIGSTSFEGNNKGSFTLIFTRFLRVKIMNKNGFDIGKHQFDLYHNGEGDVEKLSTLKGSTFNLENGVITETKLDEKSVFTEKYNNNIDLKKFSMPALKEGAIFDLQYTIKSPFETQLRPWAFQGEYPRLWSEYTVTIAPPYHYVMLPQGDQNFDVKTTKLIYGTFSIRQANGAGQDEMYSLSGSSTELRWVKKNVPSLHEEPFTTTLENYNTRVSFQLNYFQWSADNQRHDYMNNWTSASKELLEREHFGQDLSHENNWMSDELGGITAGAGSEEEKAHKIFSYIRDNFRTAGVDGYGTRGLYTHHTLKEVFKRKEGSVVEINLLLTAMLRKAGIDADPVILSTRENGIANAAYPLIDEYDYVICIAYIGRNVFRLDASESYNGFGQLSVDCFNGWGHVINESKPIPIELFADSVHESTITSVIIYNDDKGKPSGSFTSILGKSGSFDIRKEILGSSEKSYEKKIQTELGSDYLMGNFSVDSLRKFDFPATVHYDFDIKNLSSADVLYFNPMMGEGYKTNPFKSMDRHYPVEIPYQLDETYILNMDIPVGYQIDEIPQSVRVKYNENEGFFEYIIQKGETNLQMRVRLKLNKALFQVEEYKSLRDFFSNVVKKESEQIVFKKIK
jgi:Domain of Unknown Function with PDB structure (DUF3858)/Transglutaminase-like superfamily